MRVQANRRRSPCHRLEVMDGPHCLSRRGRKNNGGRLGGGMNGIALITPWRGRKMRLPHAFVRLSASFARVESGIRGRAAWCSGFGSRPTYADLFFFFR
ncbi:hypothetical protein CDAR_298071 [Caerostris darwini]|uniref:Uncharacterized protein n=1 Tax=Caerostris darwini TaxID=1538125 RepID=A0AAV4PYL2_9ARAC|nr:hypothetical protein CDAR_298071 [Caerostris darwini]